MTTRVKRFLKGLAVMSVAVTVLSGMGLLIRKSVARKASPIPVYRDPQYPIDQRIDDLIRRMTLEEKVSLLGGTGFSTKPIPRLGIP